MIDYATLEVAEKTLGSCECCNGTCHDCANIENMLDSLMLTTHFEQLKKYHVELMQIKIQAYSDILLLGLGCNHLEQ